MLAFSLARQTIELRFELLYLVVKQAINYILLFEISAMSFFPVIKQ